MLLYGGIGLLGAGLASLLFTSRLTQDADKAAQLKKQAPILMAVGAVLLGLRFLFV